jgi:hypothetical protein
MITFLQVGLLVRHLNLQLFGTQMRGGKRQRKTVKAPPRMPELDGVHNYSTRYRDVYWDANVRSYAYAENGIVVLQHQQLKSIARCPESEYARHGRNMSCSAARGSNKSLCC